MDTPDDNLVAGAPGISRVNTDHVLAVRWAPDTTLLWLSPSFDRIANAPADDFIGRRVIDFLDPGTARSLSDAIAALTPETPVSIFDGLVTVNGVPVSVRFSMQGTFDDDGRLVVGHSIGADLTEFVEMRRKLERAEARIDLILRSLRERIAVHSEDGVPLWRSSDLSAEDPSRRGLERFALYDDIDRSALAAAFLAVRERTAPTASVVVRSSADDSGTWIEVTFADHRDSSGVRGIVSVTRDVTDRHRVAELERELELRRSLGSDSLFLVEIDDHDVVRWVSQDCAGVIEPGNGVVGLFADRSAFAGLVAHARRLGRRRYVDRLVVRVAGAEQVADVSVSTSVHAPGWLVIAARSPRLEVVAGRGPDGRPAGVADRLELLDELVEQLRTLTPREHAILIERWHDADER